MESDHGRRALAAGVVLVTASLGSCSDGSGPDDGGAPENGGADCAADAAPGLPTAVDNPVQHQQFWELIEASCSISNDGDVRQAGALQEALRHLSPRQVARFHARFRKANRALYTKAFVAEADRVCRTGRLGLGTDLSTDYRSWMVAHGRTAFETVLADPTALASVHDAEQGCGAGESMTYAASAVYDELTGLDPTSDGLRRIEPVGPPR